MLNFQRFFSSRARHSCLSDLHKAARGSILGAFIGDSAGAVLEFSGKMANERDVERAVRFEGSGPRHLAPGQITGDSEMALAMMRGILACTMEENNKDYLQQSIATEYLKWSYTSPFGMGNTTYKAMNEIANHFKKFPHKDHMDLLFKEINKVNSGSLSNGCLMRATPMPVYCHKLDEDGIFEFTKLDVNLTHTNMTAVHSVTMYNIAIVHLLNNFGDRKGAIEKVEQYISNVKHYLIPDFEKYWNQIKNAKSDKYLFSTDVKMSYFMIAFTHSFYYLLHDYTYEDSIKRMLLKGGDTDTNAAIVGGLIGAKWGVDEIPQEWRMKGLKFHNLRHDYVRLENVEELEDMIDQLVIKGNRLALR